MCSGDSEASVSDADYVDLAGSRHVESEGSAATCTLLTHRCSRTDAGGCGSQGRGLKRKWRDERRYTPPIP